MLPLPPSAAQRAPRAACLSLQAVRLEELTAGLEGRGLLDGVDLDLDLGEDDELAGALAELAPSRRRSSGRASSAACLVVSLHGALAVAERCPLASLPCTGEDEESGGGGGLGLNRRLTRLVLTPGSATPVRALKRAEVPMPSLAPESTGPPPEKVDTLTCPSTVALIS